jgi:hypothetical protein
MLLFFYYYLFVGTFAIIEVNLNWESTLSKSDNLVGRLYEAYGCLNVTFQQYFSYILTFELPFLALIWCKVEIH